MTNSTKHTFSSDAGIAPGSGTTVGADMGVAMRSPFSRRLGEARAHNQ